MTRTMTLYVVERADQRTTSRVDVDDFTPINCFMDKQDARDYIEGILNGRPDLCCPQIYRNRQNADILYHIITKEVEL